MKETLNIPLLQDADLKGKVVLVRVDHNVVKKGVIIDPYRIDATIGTIHYITAKGGKIILMTHVGRPKDKTTKEIVINNSTSVDAIVDYLQKKLQVKYVIPEFKQPENKGYAGIDDSIKGLIADLKNDKIDGIYLPNTRWFIGEEAKDEKADKFAKELASIADIYVNDAFGSWQAHASTVGVTKYLPSYAGFLMQKEINHLNSVFEPKKPMVSVVAGSKFDTKIDSLNALLVKSDFLVLGGVIYNAYLAAKYGVNIEGIAEEDIECAKKFVEFTKSHPNKLVELKYIVESDTLDGKIEGKNRVHNVADLKPGMKLNFVLDAAKESFQDEAIVRIFNSASTIFVNAVMGFTPNFTEGTIAMIELIDKNKSALKLFGGGDTLQEMKTLSPGIYVSAIDNPNYYMFTGGGAVLTAIQEGTVSGLPPVPALNNYKK